MELNNKFIKNEYRKILLPVMFSILGASLTGFIDSCIVSMRLGGNAITAINLCMPILFIVSTIGILIAGGASLLTAEAAGGQRMDLCTKYYNTSVFMTAAAGFVVTVIGVLANDKIAFFLSQGTEIYDMVSEYSFMLFIGTIPFALACIPVAFLQLEGNGKKISIIIAMIVVIDTVCDFLFMYVLPWNLTGAALASIMSMIISTLYGLYCLHNGNNGFQLRISQFRVFDLKNILINGISIASNNIFDTIKLLIVNGIILSFGGLAVSCAWSVINMLGELSRTITSGIPEATGPIVSVLNGSKENDAIRNLIKLSIVDGIIMSVIVSVIPVICNKQVAEFYHIEIGMLFPLICLAVYIVFEMINNAWMNVLYRTSRPVLSMAGSIIRNFAMPVLIINIIVHTSAPIWLFLPLSQVVAMAVVLIITKIISGKSEGDHRLSGILLLDDYLKRRNTVLDFSIEPTVENICFASESIQDFCNENDMSAGFIMKLGLAIEEVFMVLRDLNPDMDSADVRIYCMHDEIGVRVRAPGNMVNIFDDSFEGDGIGIGIIKGMATDISYNYILGVNNYDIHFMGGKNDA